MGRLQLSSQKEFNNFIGNNGLSVVHFSAVWADACEQLSTILFELEEHMKNFKAAIIEAETVPEVSLACKISAAPTLIFFKAGKEVDRINGFNPSELKTKIMKHTLNADEDGSVLDGQSVAGGVQNLNERLKQLINKSRLMLFMKGTPEEPKCGFSRKTVDILKELNADFSSFDILQDEQVRQGLKDYSNWPTYPQLYLDGELIGGLDILKEEIQDPGFAAKLPKKENLNDKLRSLTNKSRLMLFMKGTPDAPRCGFSRQMVDLLRNINADFSAFDILSDEQVRQGLKEYSNWPTYPQLYLDGELIGGLDVVREELESNDFVSKIPKIA